MNSIEGILITEGEGWAMVKKSVVIDPSSTGEIGKVAPAQMIEIKNSGDIGVDNCIVFQANQQVKVDSSDIENQRTENREALEDIKMVIIDAVKATEIIKAIAKGNVRNVTIVY